jgi:hypothetical protein
VVKQNRVLTGSPLQDNNISFWRKFIAEYFGPRAKKRWCVSRYGDNGRQPTGVFPQVSNFSFDIGGFNVVSRFKFIPWFLSPYNLWIV